MNFIDYIIKKTDKYNSEGLSDPTRKDCLMTLQTLNFRARNMRERLNEMVQDEYKPMFEFGLDLDTELDEGYFDRIIIDSNKERGK